jgi:hypothetical protein
MYTVKEVIGDVLLTLFGQKKIDAFQVRWTISPDTKVLALEWIVEENGKCIGGIFPADLELNIQSVRKIIFEGIMEQDKNWIPPYTMSDIADFRTDQYDTAEVDERMPLPTEIPKEGTDDEE